MDVRVNNITQLNQLVDNTYILAVCVALFAVAISMLISWSIAWQGTPDKSYVKRRIWYIVILLFSSISFWLYNYIHIAPQISNQAWRSDFESCNNICIVSTICMICFKKSKFASILFSIKY